MIDVSLTLRLDADGLWDRHLFAQSILCGLQNHPGSKVVAVNVEDWYPLEKQITTEEENAKR